MGNPSTTVDPYMLLQELSPLLANNGSILHDEVPKMAKLMKECDNLVGRCVYLNILRVTEDIKILEAFLAQDGWTIMNTWLSAAKRSENFALVLELMKILQQLPLRIEHLKENNTPKLIKSFVKTSTCPKVKSLATSLMGTWLNMIRESSGPSNNSDEKKKKSGSSSSKVKLEKTNGKSDKPKSTKVKTAPAKFRKTGLEDDPANKPSKSGSSSNKQLKRTSGDSSELVPDKKHKPTPKPPTKKIFTSAGFMDALNSTPVQAKPRPKKKPTVTVKKAGSSFSKTSPSHSPIIPAGDAGDFGIDAIVPRDSSVSPAPRSPSSVPEPPKLNKYGKPKKCVRWEKEERLEAVRYFECEEGERVNVNTQSFKEQMMREKMGERTQLGEFHHHDPQWRKPQPILDLPEPMVERGRDSMEKTIQSEREKTVLFSIYPAPEFIPDSPAEPDPEPYEIVAPKVIPIDDPNDPGPVPADTEEQLPTNLNIPGFPLKDKLREIIQNATGGVSAENHGDGSPMQMDVDPNLSPPPAFSPELTPEGVPMYPPHPNGMPPPDQFFPPNTGAPMMMGMPPPHMQGMPPMMGWPNGHHMNYPPPGFPPHNNGHRGGPRSRGPPQSWRPARNKTWHNPDRQPYSDNRNGRKQRR